MPLTTTPAASMPAVSCASPSRITEQHLCPHPVGWRPGHRLPHANWLWVGWDGNLSVYSFPDNGKDQLQVNALMVADAQPMEWPLLQLKTGAEALAVAAKIGGAAPVNNPPANNPPAGRCCPLVQPAPQPAAKV